MKTFLALAVLLSAFATQVHAQEQRVTAKIKKQNAEHNAELEKGTATTPPAPGSAPTPSAKKDPISDLATAEKAVKFQLNAVKQAKLRADQATKSRDILHATYKGKNLDSTTYAAVMKRYDAADKEIAASAQALSTARGAFDILFDKYQKFGGTVDYRAQLPQ